MRRDRSLVGFKTGDTQGVTLKVPSNPFAQAEGKRPPLVARLARSLRLKEIVPSVK